MKDDILTAAQLARLTELADGLDVLIRFHDREVDAELVAALAAAPVVPSLAPVLQEPTARVLVEELTSALEALGPEPNAAQLDLLAADYADIYLTHGYRVAPNGSVWLTEDKLERQLPMFEVRDWYEHYDIRVPNWRVRADDHLVHELQFVSLLCRAGAFVPVQDAARFLDLHVLPWVPEFCCRAAARVEQPLYAAVMGLTDVWLEELRQELEAITGRERQVREVRDLDTQRSPEPEAAPYVPGAAESW